MSKTGCSLSLIHNQLPLRLRHTYPPLHAAQPCFDRSKTSTRSLGYCPQSALKAETRLPSWVKRPPATGQHSSEEHDARARRRLVKSSKGHKTPFLPTTSPSCRTRSGNSNDSAYCGRDCAQHNRAQSAQHSSRGGSSRNRRHSCRNWNALSRSAAWGNTGHMGNGCIAKGYLAGAEGGRRRWRHLSSLGAKAAGGKGKVKVGEEEKRARAEEHRARVAAAPPAPAPVKVPPPPSTQVGCLACSRGS